MRKKTETRKKFGRICALVVVGMFVVMTSMSVPADDPDDWTIGGDRFGGGTTQVLGTLSPDDLSIVAGGNQGIILNGHVDPIFVGIGLDPGILPRNKLDVGGGMTVGEDFAAVFPAPINGMIIEGQVGIGTPVPMEALDVEGNIHASGSLISGNSITIDGTNDKITASSGTINFDNENLVTTGNVGIGTTSPLSKLHIDGNWAGNEGITLTDLATGDPAIRFYSGSSNRWGIISSTGWREFGIAELDSNWNYIGERLTIRPGGNVGIGTTFPGEKLDVAGNVHASGSFISGSTTTYGDGFITLSTGTNLNIDSGTLFIDNANDRVGIGTTNPVAKLDVEGDYIRFRNPNGPLGLRLDAGLGSVAGIDFYEGGGGPLGQVWYSPGYSALMLETLGTHDIIISPGGWGNVGIETKSPSSTLDVNGDIEIGSGNAFYFGDPNTDGTWRITRSGNSLVFQRRESGNWVTKSTMT